MKNFMIAVGIGATLGLMSTHSAFLLNSMRSFSEQELVNVQQEMDMAEVYKANSATMAMYADDLDIVMSFPVHTRKRIASEMKEMVALNIGDNDNITSVKSNIYLNHPAWPYTSYPLMKGNVNITKENNTKHTFMVSGVEPDVCKKMTDYKDFRFNKSMCDNYILELTKI